MGVETQGKGRQSLTTLMRPILLFLYKNMATSLGFTKCIFSLFFTEIEILHICITVLINLTSKYCM